MPARTTQNHTQTATSIATAAFLETKRHGSDVSHFRSPLGGAREPQFVAAEPRRGAGTASDAASVFRGTPRVKQARRMAFGIAVRVADAPCGRPKYG
jgi:hypothetical protein